jgi:D-amino-acid oxidase
LQKKVKNIEELVGQYDIVVNCTGVEAFNLVNDNKVKPVRGQVFRVSAPWIKHAVMTANHYILPNSDSVVLGGTKQVGNWNREVNSEDSKNIMDNCCDIYPSLRSAQIIREWVGLRPGREETRIETEVINPNGFRDKLYVVHNYGHGGSGVTLFWGCAQEVLVLVNDIIDRLKVNKLSKL